MRTMALGMPVSPTAINASIKTPFLNSLNLNKSAYSSSSYRVSKSTDGFSLPSLSKSGICRASQVADIFRTAAPEIVVREARLEDCWEVAETHCACFFPGYSFPLDLALRINRLVGMFAGFSSPSGFRRTCLVAVVGSSTEESFLVGTGDLKIGYFDAKISLNKGYVAGILTVDTAADFLPRKGPLKQRRTGIAYISNVAVRDGFRRKGIAKRLVAEAEAQARRWGCRAVALHCDMKSPAAAKLYTGQGFRCINVPEGANWPKPKTGPGVTFSLLMKLVSSPATTK